MIEPGHFTNHFPHKISLAFTPIQAFILSASYNPSFRFAGDRFLAALGLSPPSALVAYVLVLCHRQKLVNVQEEAKLLFGVKVFYCVAVKYAS